MSRPPALSDVQHRRASELDALSAIVSWDGGDKLAHILTDEDVATLTHLAEPGMGENTLRPLASDLGYLEAWALAAPSNPLPWPFSEALVLEFVAHPLSDS